MNIDQVKNLKEDNTEANSLLDTVLHELVEDLDVELTDHKAKDNVKHTINSIRELTNTLIASNKNLIEELIKEKKAWYLQSFNITILICIAIAIVLSVLNLIIVLFS